MSTLARNSAARMIVDVSGLLVAVATAIVSARWLGPSGKGIYATLTVVAGLVTSIAILGLGESGIVMVGKGVAQKGDVLRANLAAAALTGTLGAVVCAAVAALVIQPGSATIWLAVGLVAISVPFGVALDVLNFGLTMQERIVQSSLVIGVISLVNLLCLCLFLVVLGLDVLGAVLAGLGGVAVGVLLAKVLISRDFSLKPRWDAAYLGQAVRYGVRLQASYLIAAMAARLDILFVFLLVGSASAGNYSVALTVGSLVGVGQLSLTYAAFPRLAYTDDRESRGLALLIWRRGLFLSLAMVCAGAAVIPTLIPMFFGSGFQPAIVPSLILMVWGAIGAGQWMLAKARAAKGDPRLLVRAYALSLVVMIALDLALIPPFGIVGAAVASSVSSLAGLTFCIVWYHREGAPASELVPRWADLVALLGTLRSMAADAARWRRGKISADDLASNGTPPASTD